LTAKRGTKHTRQRTTTELPYEDRLRNISKRFAVTDELWLDSDIFELDRFPDVDPLSSDRFTNGETYKRGTITALYQVVPEDLHDDMVNQSEF
jgi:hypothetical protein